MAKVIPKTLDSELIFQEVRDMLYQEMDYVKELEFSIRYREYCQNIKGVQVIEPIASLCSEFVFVSKFVECYEISEIDKLNLDLNQRNQLGISLLNVFFNEVFNWGFVQTDGNKGN